MTDEVGAITGELELSTSVMSDGGIGAVVSYAGGQDLYTVSRSLNQVEQHVAHELVLETLTTPDRVEGGNEMPVGLLED
jgi:hypothetical protein